MMRRATRFFALFACAAMLTGPASAVFAQAAEAPVILPAEEIGEIEQMTPQERDAWLQQKHADFEKMTPGERKRKMAERTAAYDALSPGEKQALQQRMKALRLDFYKRQQEKIEVSRAERERKMKAFLDTLTPEQRKQWEAMKEERAKWEHPGFGPDDE